SGQSAFGAAGHLRHVAEKERRGGRLSFGRDVQGEQPAPEARASLTASRQAAVQRDDRLDVGFFHGSDVQRGHAISSFGKQQRETYQGDERAAERFAVARQEGARQTRRPSEPDQRDHHHGGDRAGG